MLFINHPMACFFLVINIFIFYTFFILDIFYFLPLVFLIFGSIFFYFYLLIFFIRIDTQFITILL